MTRATGTTIVLASRSAARVALLAAAGIAVVADAADLDERAAEAPLAGAAPGEVALHLAAAKAAAVAGRHPGALVVGADQTLDLDGERFDKAESIAAALDQLRRLRGRTHRLSSAVAVARDGAVLWRHVAEAHLAMRAFSDRFLESYAAACGEELTATVGGYRLEGRGVQLFEAIEGDHFTILGLPLLPLLGFLRTVGAIET